MEATEWVLDSKPQVYCKSTEVCYPQKHFPRPLKLIFSTGKTVNKINGQEQVNKDRECLPIPEKSLKSQADVVAHKHTRLTT